MKILKKILNYLLITVGLLVVYLILATAISYIPVNRDQTSHKDQNLSIYIITNGVHTDIAVPFYNEYFDWRTYLDPTLTPGNRTSSQWVSFGWGDKGFYLQTPEWKDLKASTAFVAATGIGETALHVTYYNNIQIDESTKSIQISDKQYQALIKYIENSIELGSDSKPQLIETSAQYGQNDAFYEAHRSYSIFFTCNSWTNDALKSAGIRASKWVAFDKGILYQH